MNAAFLKSVIIKNGDTQESLAAKIGISLSRFNAKINETNGAEFNQSEILAIANEYRLNTEEVVDIFFDSLVSSHDTTATPRI